MRRVTPLNSGGSNDNSNCDVLDGRAGRDMPATNRRGRGPYELPAATRRRCGEAFTEEVVRGQTTRPVDGEDAETASTRDRARVCSITNRFLYASSRIIVKS